MAEQPQSNDETTPAKMTVAKQQKDVTQLVYILQALAPITGLTGIAALIVNYLKRKEVAGTYLESHFCWQLKTFWFTLGGFFLGVILMAVYVGMLIWMLTGLWYIYRVVKGWLALNDDREINDGFF